MRKKHLGIFGAGVALAVLGMGVASAAGSEPQIFTAFNFYPRIDPNFVPAPDLPSSHVEVFDGLSQEANTYLATSDEGYLFSVSSSTSEHNPGDPMYIVFHDLRLDKAMATFSTWGRLEEYGYRVGGEEADVVFSEGSNPNPTYRIVTSVSFLDSLDYPSLLQRKSSNSPVVQYHIEHLKDSSYAGRIDDISLRPGFQIYSVVYSPQCGTTSGATGCIELVPPEGTLRFSFRFPGYSPIPLREVRATSFGYSQQMVHIQATTAPLFRSTPPIDPPAEYKHRARLESLLGKAMPFGFLQTAVGEQAINAAGIDNLESAGFTGTAPVKFILNDVRLLPGGEAVVTVRAMSPVSIHAMNMTIAFDNLEALGIDDVVPETESVLDGATFTDYQFQRTNGSLEYRALISFDESPADLSDEEGTPLLTFRFPVPADTPVGTNIDIAVRAGIEDITQLSSAVDEAYRLVAREAGPVAIGYQATIKVRDDLDVPAVTEVVAHVLATGQPVEDVNQDGMVDSGDIQAARVR